MKILIYSDVHGNLPAFEKMLASETHCDGYICLGDLVNYGPWSNECVDLALSLKNSVNLIGNHEVAYINDFYPGSNPLVQRFFSFNIEKFNRFEIIKTFQEEVKLGKYKCTHTITDLYIYPDTTISLNENYIIGHSHHQFKYVYDNYILYNAGSVGQNRKYINVINYLIYDTLSEEVITKYLLYDVDLLICQMKIEGYPQECLNYYLNKERYNTLGA
jgi:predicted phosphodiesterase